MTIADAQLSPINTVNLTSFEDSFGAPTIAIHRGSLQRVLLDKLSSAQIRLGHTLQSVQRSNATTQLLFEDGAEVDSGVTIGADGIHSTVRDGLFPDSTIRNAQQRCWRGVADFSLPPDSRSELIEAWGDSGRFGFVQLADDKVYWFATQSGRARSGDATQTDLIEFLGGYDPLVANLVEATPADRMIISDIEDLSPMPSWHADTICLVGDAAHATTPNLGQGACQAVEDAYILSECLARFDVERAFSEFENLRLPKARQVVKYSWQLGKFAHLSNPVLRRLRNQVVKATPQSLNHRRLDKIFALAAV